jgi:hypothetical protein
LGRIKGEELAVVLLPFLTAYQFVQEDLNGFGLRFWLSGQQACSHALMRNRAFWRWANGRSALPVLVSLRMLASSAGQS